MFEDSSTGPSDSTSTSLQSRSWLYSLELGALSRYSHTQKSFGVLCKVEAIDLSIFLLFIFYIFLKVFMLFTTISTYNRRPLNKKNRKAFEKREGKIDSGENYTENHCGS